MSPRRVVVLALTTQGILIVAAWALSRWLRIPPQWGDLPRDTAIGVAGAGVLAWTNYLVLMRAPSNWVIDGVRAVYHELLVPLFGRLGPFEIIAVGAAAGLGEEWLFRGVLQPLVGLVAASAVFGLAHVGGRQMLAFGVWASVMGLLLGALATITGGLTAPAVAHGLYDILALQFLRRGAQRE